MTATSVPTVKDQELVSYGLVESASVKSIADFIPSKLNQIELTAEIKSDDFTNTFICHLIFYALFCITLIVHIFVDLGFGDFIKQKFDQLILVGKKNGFEKGPAFA